ncbi:alpha/beta hydrolase [Kaistia terrae]|uniref:Alpha/beta hydrolase n=1 Tax=Kaistia terrae TaxID=537017 RepID=A0ABW0Q200_9HYPH|nr:alpha/beta hydrolase [Kaistia terrae]MCX5580303.1 alpha/beta hydrolase [Kaistia terrae]
MGRWFLRNLKRAVVLVAVIALTLLAARIYNTVGGPPLEPWHTHVPHELTVKQFDRASWADSMKAEGAIFDDVRSQVSEKLAPDEQVPFNRYFEGSPVYPGHFKQDWNRSYILQPDGVPVGAAVFLHGLTDSPYSLRHIAERYRERGFVSVVIRLPGHGTVPAGLTDVHWEDWMAATRLAAREARRLAGPATPLHMIGFSNGGALALMYALDAIEDKSLARPDKLVLISPMVGVTRFARFAGLAGLPAIFPAFAKSAWLGIVPEFNPFKYNSFPVNGARQSYELTDVLQRRISTFAREGRLATLAPILTFQSVIDFTVSTRAVITALYDHLPANGSELVLFDINRNAKLGPLLSASTDTVLARILPPAERRFRTTVIANISPAAGEVEARTVEPGQTVEQKRSLGLYYPTDVYSLSHVALPFPTSDGLYGTNPDPKDDFGINLGAIALRGERGALIVSLDTLMRISSNPFYPYLIERIEGLMAPVSTSQTAPTP